MFTLNNLSFIWKNTDQATIRHIYNDGIHTVSLERDLTLISQMCESRGQSTSQNRHHITLSLEATPI
jgi:hypothetical protein